MVGQQARRLVSRGLIVTASLASISALAGQSPGVLELDVRFSEGFGYVGAIRPMPDGRVMVADPLGAVLVLVDLDAQIADTLGHVGQGPQEYRQPDGVLPLPGDSTLLVDLGNGRLTILAPDGRFGRTMPIVQEAAGGGGLSVVIPRFTDSKGRLYYQPEDISAGPISDSAWIARFDRMTGQIDTVAAVKLADRARQRRGSMLTIGRKPLGPRDDWAVAPDGAVAIVRADGYTVQWIQESHPPVSGPPTPFPPIKVGTAEKEAWAYDFFATSISMGVRRSADGRRRITFSRGSGRSEDLELESLEWPDHLPPFRAGRSVVSDDGNLWVQRYGAVGEPVTMDIFDRSGMKIHEVRLPRGRQVAGFGHSVVYLIYTDDLGLQWLERYR